MEPRPSRPNRPASSSARTTRAPWVPPEGSDDLTAPRTAEIYGASSPSGTPTGGPWYGPHGSLGPEPPEYRATKPPMPIKPRNERGNRWLRYLLGALLLALAVGGTAFAITWFLDDDDDPEAPAVAQATATATVESAAAATQTPETLAEPTATSSEPQPTETSAPVEPTQNAAPEDDSGAESEAEQQAQSAGEQDAGSDAGRDANAYLPTVDDLDGVWAVQAEGDRPLDDVAAALGDGGADALAQFGWQENLFRDFNREAAPEEIFFISVSVHRFDDAAGAGEALTYFSDILVAGGYQAASSVDVGDGSVALETSQDGYNLYALYVQDGNVMIRFGGSSQTGDPAAFVNAVAEEIVASA